MARRSVRKVVLAYSGGLDTSVILRWLQNDLWLRGGHLHRRSRPGRGAGAGARARPRCSASSEIFVEDLRETFVRDFVFPMFRANALYEGQYLLGTSIARPLIAQRQIEIAEAVGADAVAHGATGKGNDQVRFELAYYALKPDVTVIAPWREWDLTSRTKLLEFAEAEPDPDRQGQARRGAVLGRCEPAALLLRGQDPGRPGAWRRMRSYISAPSRPKPRPTAPPKSASISPTAIRSAIDGEALSPAALLTQLNELRPRQRHRPAGSGGEPLRRHEIAAACTKPPAARSCWRRIAASKASRWTARPAHLKDSLMPRYAELIYNGFWFAPERRMLQALIDASQASVTGRVRAEALQGQRDRDRPRKPEQPVFRPRGDVRGRRRRLRPGRCAGLHQLQALRLRLAPRPGAAAAALRRNVSLRDVTSACLTGRCNGLPQAGRKRTRDGAV